MATREDIYAAIRNADKAGDAESVRKLGAYLQTMDATPPAAQPQGFRALDAPNAVATGYNQGLLRIAGLPVDTAANVIDLGKAAIGAPYTAMTGKSAPDWLQPSDRSKVFGSSDYLISKAKGASLTRDLVTAQNPAYEGGYLQAAGGGASAIINPQTRAELANQAVTAVTSALAGKATYDATGNPALAATAGMSPLAVQRGAVEGTKRIVRGDEAGRRAMEQRIADLNAAGVDNPTLGLASGSTVVNGLENLLQHTPGAVGRMRGARDAAVAGLAGTAADAAAAASTNRGALAAGEGIQTGLKTFKDDFKARQAVLYDRLNALVGPQTPTNVDNTRATLAALNEDIQGAPEVSKFFKNARIQNLQRAVEADVNAPRAYTPSQLQSGVAAQPPSTLPFEAVKKTRTLVGNELADHSLLSDVPRSKWNPLYGALTEDIRTAAAGGGPQADRAFNRANDYTAAGMGRLERVAPLANRPAPEQSYTALANTLNENVSTFQAVKKSLPEGVRGQVAGTVIERLGKAKAGVQNDAGDVWSPDTFLTNWNKMTPRARDELLSGFPNAPQIKADIERVAQATSMMRDGSKIWNNPSGTGANLAARGTFGAIGLGSVGALAGLVNPLVPMGAVGAVAGANLLARGLTNKNVVNAFARPDITNPRLTAAQINALAGSGLLEQQAGK